MKLKLLGILIAPVSRVITITILLFLAAPIKAADYYWVGGSGDWSDLSHWAAASGGAGNAYVTTPQSTDDVFFDAASGLSSGSTISFPSATTSTCNNITFSTGVSGININGSSTARFDVNGSVTLEPDMNFNWEGIWYLYQTTDGSTNTFTTANNSFNNRLIRFEQPSSGTGGDFLVNDKFIHNTTSYGNAKCVVNLQNAGDKVIFTDTAYFSKPSVLEGFDLISGEVSTMRGFQSGHLQIDASGTLLNYGDCVGSRVSISGTVDFNAGNSLIGNVINLEGVSNGITTVIGFSGSGHYWWSGNHGHTGATVKFKHCEMTIRSYFVFGSSRAWGNNASNTTIEAGGSTLIFTTSASRFSISNHTFNNVIIEGGTTSNFQIIGAGSTGTLYPTIDTLIVNRSMSYLNYTGTGSSANSHNTYMQITGLLKFTGGNNYVGRINDSRYYLVGGATLDMQGSCVAPVGLSGITHDLTGVGTMTTNNLLFQGDCIATPGTYSAGTGSKALSGVSHTGWTIPAASPRILVWTGAIPSDVADVTTYANWYVDTNWCDVTSNPTWSSDPNIAPGNPGYCGNVCPPTEIDSVIFPDQSYVSCLESVMYCEGMNWLQNGRIHAGASQDLEIWGALHLSSEMTNSFQGTMRFRSNRPYRCAITSNGNAIYSALFNSENGAGEWLLMDDFNTTTDDSECKIGSGSSSWKITSGHLFSGTQACTPGNGVRIDALGFFMDGGELSLFDSDVHISQAGTYITNNYHNVKVEDVATIHGGTSHIYLRCSRGTSSSTFGIRADLGDDTLYDVTLENANSNGAGNTTHHLILGANSALHHLNFDPSVRPWIISGGTAANPAFIQKIDYNSTLSSNRQLIFRAEGSLPKFPAVSNSRTIMVDTIYNNGQLNCGLDLTVNNFIEMIPGYSHHIGSSSNSSDGDFCTLTLAGAQSTTHPYLNACPGGGVVNYTGAEASISGDCFSGGNTIINNGQFVINTPKPFTPSFLTISDNQITGPDVPYAAPSSTFSGVTTGWDGSGTGTPRKLRWVDASGIAGNTGDWQDANYWEQVYPTYAAAPQCPPQAVDTVLFDENSFSANNQIVELTGVTSIASMYWKNIAAGTGSNPVLKGNAAQTLNIYANLTLDANMTNDHLGTFNFMAVSGSNDFYIRTNGIHLPFRAFFNGDDNTSWHLEDDLVIDDNTRDGGIILYQGQLYTEGNDVEISRFQSIGTSYRKFDMTNSTITLTHFSGLSYPDWNITGTMVDGTVSEFDLVADGSTIYTTPSSGNTTYSGVDVFILGGKHYNRIITEGSKFTYVGDNGFSRDTMNEFIGHQSNSIGVISDHIIRADSIYIKKATFHVPYTIQSEGGRYDSVYFESDANIQSNNKFYNYASFKPGRTYYLTSGKVQWFQNQSEIDLNGGSPSSIIQFYGATTGVQSYIRKDSAEFCADYVNIRDVWAIGNGDDALNSCYGGTVNNYCSNANDWIVSSCDTITDRGESCGPWVRSGKNRGRADFNGGEFADFQGGNTFGWDDSPYPDDPEVDLVSPDKLVCSNELVTASFEVIGDLPIYFSYDVDGVTIDTVLTTPGYGFGSEDLTGAGTPTDPYVWNYQTNFPPYADSMVIASTAMEFDRCYVEDAVVKGGVMFTWDCWDPLPVELIGFDAFAKNEVSYLTWQTASEINNSHFNVQRSEDGENFETIGRVEGYGNSTQLLNYHFVDEEPLETNFYRLQQVDFNGDYEFSEARLVRFFGEDEIVLFPNPAKEVLNISLSFDKGIVTVYDITGSLVVRRILSSQTETLNTSDFNAGIYLIEITNTTTQQTHFKRVEVVR